MTSTTTTKAAAAEGRYIYCIMDWNDKSGGSPPRQFGNIGIGQSTAYTVSYKDISAVTSNVPFKEMSSSIDDIIAHQRVVEAARQYGTVLPVRFGVILKTEEGIRKLLASSYNDYVSKIARFRGKEEIGIKVLCDRQSIKKIEAEVQQQSEEIRKIKEEISSAGPGTSYLLKLRLQDAVKNETLKKIDQLAGEVHMILGKVADDTRTLKNDVEEIILNAAYLVDRSKMADFDAKVKELKNKYERQQQGLTIHRSGPWAPYSFC